MKNIIMIACVLILFIGLYGLIGTGDRIEEIKDRAPLEIKQRGWKILRYEGWNYGSFKNHGGKVWYHVCNNDNQNIQYRVFVTLWADELHFWYGAPERLSRIDVQVPKAD